MRHRPIATDEVAWSVGRSVCHDREPCTNGCTDPDAVWAVDSNVPKEPSNRWVSRFLNAKKQFEDEKAPTQDMPGHDRWSIYFKQLSRRQNLCDADRMY